MTETMAMMAPCWSCGTTFLSDPDRVTSVSVCSECNSPADMHGAFDGSGECTRTGEVVRQPLCRNCAEMVNEARRQRGDAPIAILPGAYF